MKKLSFVGMCACLLLAAPVLGSGASKFTATVDSVEISSACGDVDGNCGPATMTTRVANIHVPGSKTDLIIGVSAEIGIDTATQVKGKNGGGGTATATGSVVVSVEIDGGLVDVYPPSVTFAARTQELEAILGGVIEECTCDDTADGTEDGVCTIDVDVDCTVSDEEISLLLETLAAQHFNFVAFDVGQGEHTIDVNVTIDTDATTADAGGGGANTSNARAVKGPMNIVVQAVKSCNQDDCVAIIE